MSSRMRGQPPHRHSGEFLREVVAEVVPEEEWDRYLVFARELVLAERRAARQENSEFRIQRPECRVAGYTPKPVQRVVMKHFRRGLHGNLMWRIGERLMGRPYPSSGGALRAR